jgi:hypothetical protein
MITVDITDNNPRSSTAPLPKAPDVIITMGCSTTPPGQGIDAVPSIRHEIRGRG